MKVTVEGYLCLGHSSTQLELEIPISLEQIVAAIAAAPEDGSKTAILEGIHACLLFLTALTSEQWTKLTDIQRQQIAGHLKQVIQTIEIEGISSPCSTSPTTGNGSDSMP